MNDRLANESITDDSAHAAPYRPLMIVSQLMLGAMWISAGIFGLYIVVYYAGNLITGQAVNWNNQLPGLYDRERPASTLGIATHFVAGGILLILGGIQLLDGVRKRRPRLHRILGRVYVLASIATALGGLTFIAFSGTIGGVVMDIAFAGYGILMFVAAVQTIRHAIARRIEQHRAWALRLFALAMASWLYRMYYAFWFMCFDKLGHTKDFQGWFDYFMDFWFYLPNLIVVEIVLGRIKCLRAQTIQKSATVAIAAALLFVIVATGFFTFKFWGPSIVSVFAGS